MPRLEDLELQIKQTSTNLKGITNMANALSRLSQSSGKTNIAAKSIKELNSAIKGIKSDKASALASVASALARLASTAMSASSISSSIRQVGISINGLTESIDVEKITALASALRDIKTAASSVKGLQAVKNAAMGGGPTAGGVKSLGDSVSNKTETGDVIEKVGENAEEAAPKIEHFRKAVTKASHSGSSFAKHLLSIPLNAFKNKVTGIFKPLSNLYNSFKRIAMYRALRTALKEITQGFATGVKNLYAWSGLVGNSFKGTMDSLATSMNYLRNSLGAMVSPLLDALAPAVDVLVDKFVDLVNLVNQFFATMTGKTTWRKALKTQKEYADNTDDAAKAQARLNHQLMAFDELNNISVNNPSGRGGGGNSDDVSADDFEELELPDWAQDIKDAIDRGDWAGAGNLLAEKLNGLVDSWNAESAGDALGTKVENFLDFANSAMETFKFYDFGQKLGTFISTALSHLETKDKNGKVTGNKLGDFLSNMFNSAVSFINGFVWKLDLSPLGTALGTALTNVFDTERKDANGKSTPENIGEMIAGVINLGIGFIQGFLDTTDFKTVGEGLMETLGTAIKNIDWNGLGTAIADIAGGIISFIKGAIGYIVEHPSDIIDAFGDFFSGLWGENGEGLANVVELVGWIAGIKLAFGGLKSTFSSVFGSALTGGAAEAFSATGSAATAVKGYMDSFAGKLGTVALVVGLTYIIATSGELNTPEKTAEKVEKENPFFNVFEEGDSDAFKAGFIDALKNDPEVKAAYDSNLYQWGKDSAHQDQNAALAAARKVFEAKFNLENSGSSGSGKKSWVKQFTDGLKGISNAASSASKKVKQLPPDDDTVSKFQTQTDKEKGYLNGDKNSLKSAAKDAHDNGVSKMGPTTSDGNNFWTKVKNNLTTHLTGDSNSFVAKAGVAGTAGVKRLTPTKTDGNTFWSALNTNLTTHLTGDKNSFVAKADVAGTASINRLTPDKTDGNNYWTKLKDNFTTHLTGDKSSIVASADSAGSKTVSKLTPSKTDGNNFWTSLKNNFATHLTGDKNSISSAAGTASGKVAGIGTELGKVTGSQYGLDIDYSDVTGVSNAAKTTYDYLSDSASKTWTIKAKGDFEFKAVPSPDGKDWMYASGGFPSVGSMFVAGEAGPELVGTINGRNAVVSGGEISGISDAVYDTGEAETALLQQLLTVGRQLLAKSGQVTLAPNAAAGRWVAQSQAAYARATGG